MNDERRSAIELSNDGRAGDRPVRVLMVAPSLRYLGGQAIQAQRLAEHLNGEAWVTVHSLPVDPELPHLLRPLQRIKYVRTVVTTLAYIISLFRNVPRCDVVHAFSASYWSFLLAPAPAILVARLFGKRVFVNYRSGEAEDHLKRWGWHAVPLLRMATGIVVPSRYLVEVFAKFGLAATPIPNFLNIASLPYRRRINIQPRLLSNRNFEVHYNVSDILRAFSLIQEVHPDAALDVVGDGPERNNLEKLSIELSLRNVHFLGALKPDRMRAQYDSADVYLNTPLIDNMPGSILEAFACGLPVVTSDAGGIPFIVQHEHNGLLVPSGDAGTLANAALRLLSDQALALRLADTAREEALQTYTWNVVRAGWADVYRAQPPVPGSAS